MDQANSVRRKAAVIAAGTSTGHALVLVVEALREIADALDELNREHNWHDHTEET
jgi:uncharacterized protein YoaH (UPF0181 family)